MIPQLKTDSNGKDTTFHIPIQSKLLPSICSSLFIRHTAKKMLYAKTMQIICHKQNASKFFFEKRAKHPFVERSVMHLGKYVK